MSPLIPVVLAGGAGTRLWPVSREAQPKPFIRLPDGDSLLQKAFRRAVAPPSVSDVIVVTNRDYYFQARDHLAAVNAGINIHYLLEPFGKNTAPAIALAAHYALTIAADAALLVLPADHLIQDLPGFVAATTTALQLADGGSLVTFGIKPTAPETGYGYIERGDPAGNEGFRVRRFVEKPDTSTAQQYLDSGLFYWNAGIFCFRADTMLAALAKADVDLSNCLGTCWAETSKTTELPRVIDAKTLKSVPDISIDYALMERADSVAVIPAHFDWSDIGSWGALGDLFSPDESGNRIAGEAVTYDTRNCLLQSDDRLIAAIGLDDLIIVDTPDALLVVPRDRAQDVKHIVAQLKTTNHQSYRFHRTVYRPWGAYTVLEEGPGFKIKRIVVKPGASLSLQLHHHRSEHWVVVNGTAKVVNGDQELLVSTNESSYIPAGTPHRLMNPGVIDCVMIEVQTGQYLGEDDIVRLQDNYGRC